MYIFTGWMLIKFKYRHGKKTKKVKYMFGASNPLYTFWLDVKLGTWHTSNS